MILIDAFFLPFLIYFITCIGVLSFYSKDPFPLICVRHVVLSKSDGLWDDWNIC